MILFFSFTWWPFTLLYEQVSFSFYLDFNDYMEILSFWIILVTVTNFLEQIELPIAMQ